jgi:acetyl-CoA carboxylase, biotin carboxylase subunit
MIGDKSSAREIAKKMVFQLLKVAMDHRNVQEGLKIAKKIGYPVMIKASSGGGGRGISIVRSDEEFMSAFERTSMEAEPVLEIKSLYISKNLLNHQDILKFRSWQIRKAMLSIYLNEIVQCNEEIKK